MELDARKKKILQAVIKNYLETGEPVGSRTISKYTDLELSAATIRNEMADLEEMGYIFQPHTSAGRIPTDAGYRLYVDDMLQTRAEQMNSRQEEPLRHAENTAGPDRMEERFERIETVLKDVVKMLAVNTNYTSVVSMPQANRNRLKFLQLTLLDSKKLLCTIVLEGNIVKNEMISIKDEIDQQTLLKLNLLMNSTLNGLTLKEINFDMAARMAEQADKHGELVSDILSHIVATIGSADGIEIFTSGAKNIFRYPELADSMRAGEIISTLEEKELLTELMTEDHGDDSDKTTGIQVYIGKETPVNSMKDCSVITATYEFEKGVYGKVGIIGPKRMDYEKVVAALSNVTDSLDKKFNKDK
ncbi:MAG: heat-inducible transcription repressor HrcA [Parasporobacterium sp.]|nr:heat-inducible transcription repressor HrcA [Parasporobacterium sp.]